MWPPWMIDIAERKEQVKNLRFSTTFTIQDADQRHLHFFLHRSLAQVFQLYSLAPFIQLWLFSDSLKECPEDNSLVTGKKRGEKKNPLFFQST